MATLSLSKKLSSIVIAIFTIFTIVSQAQANEQEFLRATVLRLRDQGVEIVGDYEQPYQNVVLLINNEEVGIRYMSTALKYGGHLHEGDAVVVLRNLTDGDLQYSLVDIWRLPWLGAMIGFFLFLVIWLSGWRGLGAISGLFASIAGLIWLVVPALATGASPVAIALLTAFVLGAIGLFLGHGWNYRSRLSAIAMGAILALAVLGSWVAISVMKLFGLGSDEALSLSYGQLENINVRGLLLGSLIIGVVGVLDDIVTAQVAVVMELREANPNLTSAELAKHAIVVGREHITSLVNTLALAYAGGSLPLLLALSSYTEPWWVIMNSEFVGEEIMRTLVGSTALLLAVPITTHWVIWRVQQDAKKPTKKSPRQAKPQKVVLPHHSH